MTAEGHLIFSVACAVLAKNTELTPVLAQGDWWHIIPAAVVTCLMPDIDHPMSFLGQRLPWISRPVARIFGHRGFTHSLLAIIGALALFYLQLPESKSMPADTIQGMVVGYLSHIIGDMLTPAGVPLLWPCRWRFRLPVLMAQKNHQPERVLCIALLVCAVWIPHSFADNSTILWSSKLIQSLQDVFNHLLESLSKF